LILHDDLLPEVELPVSVAGTFPLPEISLVYRVLRTLDFQQKFEHEVVAVEVCLVEKDIHWPLGLNFYQGFLTYSKNYIYIVQQIDSFIVPV